MSVELYFDMIGRKTAALIAASIEAGALLATDDEEVIARYRGFGWALGLAFQLNDDLLGIWGAEQATGKEPSDLARHKKTLPVHLRVRARRTPDDRERLATPSTRRPSPSPAEVAEAVAILERLGRPRLHPRPGPRATATRPSPSSTRPASCEPDAREALESIIVRVIAA